MSARRSAARRVAAARNRTNVEPSRRRSSSAPVETAGESRPAPVDIDLTTFVPWLTSSLTRHLHGIMTEALTQLDVSIADWRVMLCLSKADACTLTEVVEFTGLIQSSLSRALVRLENIGLITRSRRRADARLMSIRLTPVGHTVCSQATHVVRQACDAELEVLTRAERETFVRIAHKLLAEIPAPRRSTGILY